MTTHHISQEALVAALAQAAGTTAGTHRSALQRILYDGVTTSAHWRMVAAVLDIPLTDLCADADWIAAQPPIPYALNLTAPLRGRMTHPQEHPLRGAANRAAVVLREIMVNYNLTAADIARDIQDQCGDPRHAKAIDASVRACAGNRPPCVTTMWPMIAHVLEVPLSALCDDQAWIAAQPPLAVANIHDDTAALNGSPEEDGPSEAAAPASPPSGAQGVVEAASPNPPPPDAPKHHARWVITAAPPPGLTPADAAALTLGRTIRDALHLPDAAAVAEAIERAARAERMVQVLSVELDALRADVARAVEAVAKMRAALISVA